MACIAPLIYTLLLKCAKISVNAPPLIFILLLICTGTEFLLAFFWDTTYEIFGANHSVVLMILLFVMSMINATSNVLFMPYMAAFHQNYLTAYFVGMGLSSLIPSIISLLQGKKSGNTKKLHFRNFSIQMHFQQSNKYLYTGIYTGPLSSTRIYIDNGCLDVDYTSRFLHSTCFT